MVNTIKLNNLAQFLIKLESVDRLNILVSAGSTLKTLDYLVGDFTDFLNKNFTDINLIQVDERYGDNLSDSDVNRLKFLNSSFVKAVNWSSRLYFPNKPSQQEFSIFDQSITNLYKMNKQIFTLAFLGVGGDYHIAGIKPESEQSNIINYNNILYYQAEDYPQRASINPDFIINYIDLNIISLVGEEKIDIFKNIKESSIPKKSPASILTKINDEKILIVN